VLEHPLVVIGKIYSGIQYKIVENLENIKGSMVAVLAWRPS
jgi:hypothetical protein